MRRHGRIRLRRPAADRRGHHAVPAAHDRGGVRTVEGPDGRTFLQVEPEALHPAGRDGDARHRALPAAGAPGASCAKILDDPEAVQQRPVRRPRPAQERQHRGRRCPADVPGHRHGDRHGQARPAGAHRGRDEEPLSRGVYDAYTKLNLRYSQMRAGDACGRRRTPAPTCPRRSSCTPTPPPATRRRTSSCSWPRAAARPTSPTCIQETKAVLNPTRCCAFLDEKMRSLGHRRLPAVPPGHRHRRHQRRVRAEDRQVRLARSTSTRCRPPATRPPATASATSRWRQKVLELTRKLGIGAQFGGKYFCHDVRVIRLPRHGASLPGRDRGVLLGRPAGLGKITPDGVFLEQLETDPAQYLPEIARREHRGDDGDVGRRST